MTTRRRGAVPRQAHNLQVVGSNPTAATKLREIIPREVTVSGRVYVGEICTLSGTSPAQVAEEAQRMHNAGLISYEPISPDEFQRGEVA